MEGVRDVLGRVIRLEDSYRGLGMRQHMQEDCETVDSSWKHVKTHDNCQKKQILAAEMTENEHYWFKNVWRKQERVW